MIKYFLYPKLFDNFSKFISPDDAKMHLSKIKVRNSTILVKGSRGMELEKLLDVL